MLIDSKGEIIAIFDISFQFQSMFHDRVSIITFHVHAVIVIIID